eukprot:715076-Pelagomonas_calceolata.AAC.3
MDTQLSTASCPSKILCALKVQQNHEKSRKQKNNMCQPEEAACTKEMLPFLCSYLLQERSVRNIPGHFWRQAASGKRLPASAVARASKDGKAPAITVGKTETGMFKEAQTRAMRSLQGWQRPQGPCHCRHVYSSQGLKMLVHIRDYKGSKIPGSCDRKGPCLEDGKTAAITSSYINVVAIQVKGGNHIPFKRGGIMGVRGGIMGEMLASP